MRSLCFFYSGCAELLRWQLQDAFLVRGTTFLRECNVLKQACIVCMQDVVEPSSSTPAVDANQAIAGLPGVDPNDPNVQAALRNVQGDKKEEGGDKK